MVRPEQVTIEKPLARSFDFEKEAFQVCSRAAQTHYENFPVGSRLVAKKIRPHIHAVYAFARTADDFADESQFEGHRLEYLSLWREKLLEAAKGRATDSVFKALSKTIQLHNLPVELLDSLIQAFEQDVVQNRHESFQSLLDYSKRSANPVGRLVLWLHGIRDEKLFEKSDAICTALQLTNFWQDIAVDLKKNRVYLPRKDMERFCYSEKQLFAREFNSSFRELLKLEVKRTWELFEQGRSLCDEVETRLKMELRLIYIGGTTILKKIEALDFNVLTHRPVLTGQDKIHMLWKLATWKKAS